MNIALVSDDFNIEGFSADPRYKGIKVFKVSEGNGPIQGCRIHTAYIDWYCFEDPNYLACLSTIRNSIDLTCRSGQMVLM